MWTNRHDAFYLSLIFLPLIRLRKSRQRPGPRAIEEAFLVVDHRLRPVCSNDPFFVRLDTKTNSLLFIIKGQSPNQRLDGVIDETTWLVTVELLGDDSAQTVFD